ncbi:MAG TPA: DUF1573 domain-containing protein [Saprospiraceae bacterium]|nr:DUF1573 domain-containing protein [Saprospiraceae bacterium]
MVRLISAFIIILFLVSACSNESGDKKILEKIAGKDYSKIIEIPTDSNGNVDTTKMARIRFDESVFDFDTILKGDIVQKNMIFTNTGVRELYILQANASCGCTVTRYPKDPVAPGEQDTVLLTFDSKGQNGVNNKKVTIYTNTFPAEKVLQIKGFVKEK